MKKPDIPEEERRFYNLKKGDLERIGKIAVIGSVLLCWVIYSFIKAGVR